MERLTTRLFSKYHTANGHLLAVLRTGQVKKEGQASEKKGRGEGRGEMLRSQSVSEGRLLEVGQVLDGSIRVLNVLLRVLGL